ncbi:uncharacterized protein JN550_011254 [Neoarthrinium moseri]|uniref:uncharacterized protein n=1 Tax=Neoarthrinium moseri TaxID=1658444 RepID=UPI001FDB025C|nr:uncharacterized protein JN550_011254 [Neoarthrinium moseri]KAI1860792.1 hypothetical protein JN550_011254 [Neoarthrinium moseri]
MKVLSPTDKVVHQSCNGLLEENSSSIHVTFAHKIIHTRPQCLSIQVTSDSANMAEAVATLSLASSILQVIDFGTKVATTAFKAVRASKLGREDANEVSQLQVVYQSLSSTLKTIQEQYAVNKSDSQDDGGMGELAKGCTELAKELVQTLHKIGLADAKTKRRALWAALKLAWKKEEIVSLQGRLGEFRSQLTLCLLLSVRHYASQSLSRQEDIRHSLGSPKESRMGLSVVEYVTSGLSESSRAAQMDSLRSDLLQAIQGHASLSPQNSHSELEVTEDTYNKAIALLLHSLEYRGMKDREDRISDAHEKTFKWVFDDTSNERWFSFKDWLQSDERLYWVTGKAGSGQSTLMRYVSGPGSSTGGKHGHPRCREYLDQWAVSRKLIIASFYFWNSGLQVQTTQKGLLMTLLRQILEECPDLLSFASPSRWESLCLFGQIPDWQDSELQSIFHLCIRNLKRCNAAAALFVDGLDEFEGDPEDLLSTFKGIDDFSDYKLCVASRPWVEFQDRFYQKPSLMLEHLTYNDIKDFIVARFDSDARFAQLRRRERQFADQLVEDIVSKASGVFLWVSLVVSSLLSGMGNGDRVADFQRRLNLLPPDLTDLYEKILQSLDPFYLEHAAQLFSLVGASGEPMSLLLASFVDEENPIFAVGMAVTPLSAEEIGIRIDTVRRRINSRSKGLLEVKGGVSTPQGFSYDASSHENTTVQFLHRTVKEYIESPGVRQTLKSALNAPFDPHLKLLAGHLAYIKGMDLEAVSLQNLWNQHAVKCLAHARAVQQGSIYSMIRLLDQLDNISDLFLQSAHLHRPFSLIPHQEMVDFFGYSFLSLATACNVVEYVRAKAVAPCICWNKYHTDWPLLMNVVALYNNDPCPATLVGSAPDTSDGHQAMIKMLLNKGADPNFAVEAFHDTDLWLSPLGFATVRYMTTNKQPHLEALRLLANGCKFDTVTLDRIMELYIYVKGYVPVNRKELSFTFWYWHRIRRRLRKAFICLNGGGSPDFGAVWEQLCILTLRKEKQQWKKVLI